jgi:pimeloyl-ACP methyl ester carboxylesterase
MATDKKTPGIFVMMLRAQDVHPNEGWVPSELRRCVVFLHGWLQSHTSWLATAHRVRERFGHDCLLLDWPAHGLSDVPPDPTSLTATSLVECLHELLERSCWVGQRRITLAACSLGGAVAMRYTSLYPDDIDRLVLVAPAGFDEPWHRVSRVGPVLSRLRKWAVLPGRARAFLSVIRNTPRYGNAQDWFDSEAARSKPTLLINATLDGLHRADNWSGCRADDATFRKRTLPLSHSLLCVLISQLRLDLDSYAWHGALLDAGIQPGEVVMRARL